MADWFISLDPSLIQLDVVHRWLHGCYWSPGIRRDVVERAFASSIVAGAYRDGRQLGVARANGPHGVALGGLAGLVTRVRKRVRCSVHNVRRADGSERGPQRAWPATSVARATSVAPTSVAPTSVARTAWPTRGCYRRAGGPCDTCPKACPRNGPHGERAARGCSRRAGGPSDESERGPQRAWPARRGPHRGCSRRADAGGAARTGWDCGPLGRGRGPHGVALGGGLAWSATAWSVTGVVRNGVVRNGVVRNGVAIGGLVGDVRIVRERVRCSVDSVRRADKADNDSSQVSSL